MTKRVVGTGLALAAVLLVVVGLNSVRTRQLREAEAARSSNGLAAAAAVAPVITPVAQPAAVPSSSVPPAPEPPAAATATEAPAQAQPEAVGAAVAKPGLEAAGGPVLSGGTMLVGGPALAAVASPVPVHEMLLDTKLAGGRQSPLVSDAERALLKGQTERALTLARQAVAENATDAEAWLTLAAAQKSSGDFAGARQSYDSCIAQALTVGLNHCRVLATRSER